jgi:hypothetical protein
VQCPEVPKIHELRRLSKIKKCLSKNAFFELHSTNVKENAFLSYVLDLFPLTKLMFFVSLFFLVFKTQIVLTKFTSFSFSLPLLMYNYFSLGVFQIII